MDALKKPETIISLTNTAVLLGASSYFYRRINGLEEDLDKYSEHLTNTIRKVRDMQITKQHVKQLAGAIRELNNIMGSQRNEISYLKDLTSYQREQLKEIQGQTKELGGECTLTRDLHQVRYGNTAQNYRSPQGQQAYQSPAQQAYQSPAQQAYQSPAQQAYQPPAQQAYQPQSQQSYQGQAQQAPAQQAYQPPAQQAYQPPSQQAYQSPAQQGYQPQSQQAYQPPAQQGYQPQSQQAYQPQSQQGYQPPSQQAYQPESIGLLDGNSLIDFAGPSEDDDLDLQIDAVRRARSQNNANLQQAF